MTILLELSRRLRQATELARHRVHDLLMRINRWNDSAGIVTLFCEEAEIVFARSAREVSCTKVSASFQLQIRAFRATTPVVSVAAIK